MAKDKFVPKTTPQGGFKLDIDWAAYWEWFKSALPKVTLYPIAIIQWVLSTLNTIL